MRTTITLDEDIHELALIYANARDITMGAALSELVRNGLSASSRSSIETAPNGLPLVRSRGRKITPEMVKAAQEDDFE